MPLVSIDTAASGDNTLVAGQAGLRINVNQVVLVAKAAVDVRWKSGASTNLSGVMSLAANSGYSANSAIAVLRTNLNDDLVLNLASAVQVSGHLAYYFSPDTTP